jgi:hypothetical protein
MSYLRADKEIDKNGAKQTFPQRVKVKPPVKQAPVNIVSGRRANPPGVRVGRSRIEHVAVSV